MPKLPGTSVCVFHLNPLHLMILESYVLHASGHPIHAIKALSEVPQTPTLTHSLIYVRAVYLLCVDRINIEENAFNKYAFKYSIIILENNL